MKDLLILAVFGCPMLGVLLASLSVPHKGCIRERIPLNSVTAEPEQANHQAATVRKREQRTPIQWRINTCVAMIDQRTRRFQFSTN